MWLNFAFGQAPVFKYTPATNNYTAGSPINQLKPISSGGAVPATVYGQVTTFAGDGQPGTADGTGTAASLSGPIGIALDGSGNLYVTDYFLDGIPYINDFIRKITPAAVVTTLAGNVNQGYTDGQGNAAMFFAPSGTAVDLSGNVYVADVGNNVIRKVTPTGLVSTFAGTGVGGHLDGPAGTATFNGPVAIAIDGSNTLYVVDYNNNAIRKVSPTGQVTTLAGGAFGSSNGTGANATFRNPLGVVVDNSGNVYVADAGNNLVRKITPVGVVTTLAGNGSIGSKDGPALSASFSRPTGITVDVGGNVYIADDGNNSIREITTGGQVVTLAGNGSFGSVNGVGKAASFNDPQGLAFDPSGVVYVGEKGGNLVRKLVVTGYTISPALPLGLNFDVTSGIISGTPEAASPTTTYTITGYNASGSSTAQVTITVTGNNGIPPIVPPNISYVTPQIYKVNLTINNLPPTNKGGAVPPQIYGGVTTYAGTGVPGSTNNTDPSQATFNSPNGTGVDASGNVYVADEGGNYIRKITPAGVVTTIAGDGTVGQSNGPGNFASFNGPQGIAVDASGNVFVADFGNNVIREVSVSGQVSTIASGFNGPTAVAVDGLGNLYVADSGNQLIKKITPGGVVTVFAGSGAIGANDGVGTAASFSIPTGIAIDAAGYLYVSDAGDGLIRKITPGGLVSTLAGSGTAGSSDGLGTAASFKSPAGLTVDAIGNVYVDDAGNDEIRKITPGGLVTTLAGSAGVPGRGNGQGAAATFNDPRGISIDNKGNLYIGDLTSNLVREISTNGYVISTGLPAGLVFDGKTGVISGTPTAASPATNYTVTAYNGGGSSTTIVNITVQNPVIIVVNPPNISYETPQTYVINTPILQLQPANTGGNVPQTIYGQVSTFAGSGSAGSANGAGTAASFSVLHGIVTDLVGNVYICDNNLIRKITPSGVVSTLAGSGTAGYADGQGAAASFNQPLGITVDGFGNVYVADTKNNVIREITQAGQVTTVAGVPGVAGLQNGSGASAKFNDPTGIAVDQGGNVYVSDAGNSVIREITPAGVVSTFASGFSNPANMSASQSGNIYVAETGTGSIKKINANGQVSTVASGFNGVYGVSVDVAGNIYVAESGSNRIRKINPSGVITTLSGTGAAGAINGDLAVATFNKPYGVAADIFGNIYVTDANNNLTRKIVTTGYTIDKPLPAGLTFDGTTGFISGTPTVLSPATDYTVTAYNTGGSSTTVVNITVSTVVIPPVNKPDISYNPDNNVYLINRPIASLVPVNKGGILPTNTYGLTTTIAGNGTAGSLNGTGTAASFNEPFGVATDIQGNLYVVDHLNNLIRKITPAGVVTTFAGSGAIGKQDGTGTAATFNNPTGIAVDRAGNVYVADESNNLIRKITPAGVVTTLAGSGQSGSQDGQGTAASFSNPSGIAVDVAGNVYVTDLINNKIRKITPGGLVTTLAGSGFSGSADGTGSAATFNQPYGIAVDQQGNVFVTDWGNDLIRKITPTGVVTTIAGSGSAGLKDGVGNAASFNQPFGIAVDEHGDLYVADTGNEEIREITPAGLVTTVAGDGKKGSSDGISGSATFYQPTGVVSDGAGNIYIADEFNQLIRRVVVLSNYTIDKPLPAGLTFDHTTGIISGTPTALSPPIVYTVTATNDGGSSSYPVTISVVPAPLLPQTITFGPTATAVYGDADFDPGATSTNTTIPITYTSSNTGVAAIVNGEIHIIAAGTSTITANQAANDVYSAAVPVSEILTITPAPLTITIDDKTRAYGVANPAFTVTYTGFVYTDNASSLTSKPVLTTIATSASAVGTYPITGSGDVSPNYTPTYVPGVLTVTAVPSMIGVPSAFTPNGDLINDVWNIKFLDDFPDATVDVYNRYGALVFHSNGYSKPWDGTCNGSPLPTGTYYYIINPRSGLPQRAGSVTIIR